MRLRVKRTIEWDMRKVKALYEKHHRLAKGECIVAFNHRGTIFKAVDWTGGIHHWYLAAGNDPWDFAAARDVFREACGVELIKGRAPAVVRMPRRKERKKAA